LRAAVQPGADDSLTFALNSSVSGAVQTTGGAAVTSKGAPVLWGFSAGAVVGYVDADATPGLSAGDRVIFTLTPTAGGFTVDLQDQIDHENGINNGDNFTLDLNIAPLILMATLPIWAQPRLY
jgi:hypothetical protein